MSIYLGNTWISSFELKSAPISGRGMFEFKASIGGFDLVTVIVRGEDPEFLEIEKIIEEVVYRKNFEKVRQFFEAIKKMEPEAEEVERRIIP